MLGGHPGELREEITILEESGSSVDGLGGNTAGTFAPLAVDSFDYASIVPVSARRRIDSIKADAPVTVQVIMRYRTDIDTTHRLRWDSNGSLELKLVSGPFNHDAHREFIRFDAIDASSF